MALLFEWDSRKANTNLAKHGVTFDEASTVFQDALAITVGDPLHSEDEERFVLVGHSHRSRLLVVIHTERGNQIRIISARPATGAERSTYEKNA